MNTTAFFCEECGEPTPSKFQAQTKEFVCVWCANVNLLGGRPACERKGLELPGCGCVPAPVIGCPCDVRGELDEAAMELAEDWDE